MTPLIRHARVHEYDTVRELLAEAYLEFVSTDYLVTLRDVEARANAHATELLVAVDPPSGEIVGTATFTLPGSPFLDALPPGVPPDDANHAGMRMMAVTTSVRKAGVGTALVLDCMARTRLAGCPEMAFVTMDTMTDAWRLYERLGFARVPERDKWIPSDALLPAFVQSLTPWPRVRVARPEEYAHAGDVTVSAYLRDGFVAPTDAYAAELRDAEDRAARATLLVAVDHAGTVLGTITVCPEDSPYREIGRADELEFRMLGVSAQARNQGIGEALVRSVLTRAHVNGKRAVALLSLDEMHGAHRLYERLGFRRDPERDWNAGPGVLLRAFVREV